MRSVRAGCANLAIGLLALAAFGALAGCGGTGSPSTAGEREGDVAILNVAIGQDMALVDAYRRAGTYVRDRRNRALFRQLVAQEQEHIDGWTKAMRGLGGQVDAEPEELDYSGIGDERDYLLFAYALTSAELTHFLEDVTQLSTPAPRSFSASIAASEAQHLVVLRQALGAGLLEAVPDSFDTGEVPPPQTVPSAGGAQTSPGAAGGRAAPGAAGAQPPSGGG
jgi:rubrerythrin